MCTRGDKTIKQSESNNTTVTTTSNFCIPHLPTAIFVEFYNLVYIIVVLENVQNSCINPDTAWEQIDHFVHWFWNGEGLSYHFCLIDQNGVLDALGYGVCVAQAHQIPCIQCRFLDLTHLCSWQRTDLQQAQ